MNEIDAHLIDEHRAKGEYAIYKVKKLRPINFDILEVLKETGEPLTSRAATSLVHKKRKARREKGYKSQGQISGRLSEMGRIGLVRMFYAKVRLVDEETMEFNFRKTPHWEITDKGKRALELRRIP